MNLRRFWTPRYLGAGTGLLASAIACGVVIYQLVQAARPAPTSVRVVNERAEPVLLRTLTLSERPLINDALSLPAKSGADATGPAWDSRTVDLPPGLPMALQATFSPAARDAGCTLEPRPRGRCQIQVRLTSAGSLLCEVSCADPAAAPAASSAPP